MLFSVLSSKRTLSSHCLPNPSQRQGDVEREVSKETVDRSIRRGGIPQSQCRRQKPVPTLHVLMKAT